MSKLAVKLPTLDSFALLERIEANVPPSLRNLPIWLLHRDKRPIYSDGTPRSGPLDSPEDRIRLVTFKEIESALIVEGVDGVGVALGTVPGTLTSICGIDLDDCYDGNQLSDRAQKILDATNSYAERSPSGAGMHILGLGNIGTTKVQDESGGLEIYSHGRYFTVTGDALNKAGLFDITEVAATARPMFGRKPSPTVVPTSPRQIIFEGGRNNFLISEAGRLQRVRTQPIAISAAIHALNQQCCHPPLDDAEVEAIVRSILRYDPLPEPKDPAQRFPLIADEQFVNRPPLQWFIKGILPRAEIAVLYGAPGSGKSFFAFDMAAAISTGLPWRGRNTTKGRVVFVLAEGAIGYGNRIKAYAESHGGAFPGISLVDSAPNLMVEADCAALADAICAGGGAELVVIDTLAAASPGADENAGKDMGRIIDNCKRIAKQTGATVLLIHHSGKDESKGARGWSGLKAAVDAEIEVTRHYNDREACATKIKDGEDGARFPFVLVPLQVGVDADGDPLTSCVVEHVNFTPAERRRQLPKPGSHERTVLDYMKETVVDVEGKFLVASVVDGAALKLPKPDGRDTRKQHVRRSLVSLGAKGFIAMEDDVCRLL